ncbi:alpha-amylase [Xylanibacter muris]|uniref:Alpha-amylase n=1 Tax=Xylanibacter muris TaxID=2736290 RepID=A0ABX2AK79_9BACT|nr:alpha-amylase [Xylanibacter muris]NPD91490.1 alpha-amylase [Xylanibacter muris]
MKNGVMMQYFEWNLPDDGSLWKQLKEDAQHLHDIGVTAVWIPPAYKGCGTEDVGYGTYDLYDLGEFDQKGAVRTKYGTKQELIEMIEALHACDICVYLDAVMNHKAGADHIETCMARLVDPDDRDQPLCEPYEIECWTGFDFPGRGEKYSDFKWHWFHFSGTDYNERDKKTGIYQIVSEGKAWSVGVDNENGNYDYLMFSDIDLDHPDVIADLKHWGIWVTKETKIDGMRLDAIKHMNDKFTKQFLEAVRAECGAGFYAVGEYWIEDIETMEGYLANVEYGIDLFDVCLHYNMHKASKNSCDYDLRTILDNTLVSRHPELAVTFVDNHDSQQGSSLESYIEDWFKPSAYALILLMEKGYPCIFYGDYYGTEGNVSPHKDIIEKLLDVRQRCAHGIQTDYFDHPCTIGFTRQGVEKIPGSGLALLISNGEDGEKQMNVGIQHAGEVWHEITGNRTEEVTIDNEGNGLFFVSGGKAAVWTP